MTTPSNSPPNPRDQVFIGPSRASRNVPQSLLPCFRLCGSLLPLEAPFSLHMLFFFSFAKTLVYTVFHDLHLQNVQVKKPGTPSHQVDAWDRQPRRRSAEAQVGIAAPSGQVSPVEGASPEPRARGTWGRAWIVRHANKLLPRSPLQALSSHQCRHRRRP